MIEALKKAASHLAAVAPDIKAGSGKGLEALVLFSIAAEAKALGAEVSARGHASQEIAGPFILRGGPGHLADPHGPADQPSFFAADFGGQIFELHNSLEFLGSSNTPHEVDVSAVWRFDAQEARKQPKRMIVGAPAVGVELKEFAAATTLDKNIVRAFFACIVDLIPIWVFDFMHVGKHGGRSAAAYFHRPEDQFWVLTTANLTGPTVEFATSYAIATVQAANSTDVVDATKVMAARIQQLASHHPGPLASLPSARMAKLREEVAASSSAWPWGEI